MENEVVKIENLKDGDLLIRMKPGQWSEKELYHTIISILSWAESLHKIPGKQARRIRPQFILEAFAQFKFWQEHVYKPLQGLFFKELERKNGEK